MLAAARAGASSYTSELPDPRVPGPTTCPSTLAEVIAAATARGRVLVIIDDAHQSGTTSSLRLGWPR